MLTLDENIFGRIALLNNYLRADQLEECLEIQRNETPHRRIGDILREKGYLTEEQLRTILEVRRKKLRKVQRNPRDLKEGDQRFGALALEAGNISMDDLEEAILEQQRLGMLGLHFRLGEILLARSKMKIEQVLELLRIQGKRILLCARCDNHYNVRNYRDGTTYRCEDCNGKLVEPKFLDTVAVDATIDGEE